MAGLYPEWTKAMLCRPKDSLVTEGLLRARERVMVTTLEKCPQPVSMSMLIGNEYQRMWLKDRKEFEHKKKEEKRKFIENDFEWWLKLHKTNRCFCAI